MKELFKFVVAEAALAIENGMKRLSEGPAARHQREIAKLTKELEIEELRAEVAEGRKALKAKRKGLAR